MDEKEWQGETDQEYAKVYGWRLYQRNLRSGENCIRKIADNLQQIVRNLTLSTTIRF
ncbi:MAG: hypothetical protein LUE29_03900 [Lachnospiraceae bacterium]|nr:hypothetical protein [Lachnospiraceae bacterium]